MRGDSPGLALLTTLALLSAAAGAGCSRTAGPAASGEVKLAVVLPSGTTISAVIYRIVSSGGSTIGGPGTFQLSDPNATISLDIVVPVTGVGDLGDTVQLTATAGDGVTCTGTSAPFPVLAGTNPSVTMTLTCGATPPTATGNLGVTAMVVAGDHCPNITSGVLSPAQTSIGSTVSVSATASDADLGETLSYAWAPAVNFANPTAASTTYLCTMPYPLPITLTVTDSHDPPCSTTATFTVTCTGPTPCGDGIIEQGEQCDPPNGTTCNAMCQLTETSPLFCGNCEAAGTASGVCELTSAPGGGSSTANFGCSSFTNATDRNNCTALQSCLKSAACINAIHGATLDYGEPGTYPQPFDDPHPCLCGDVPLATCVSMTSGWSGVCAPQYVNAATADGLTVGNAYGNVTSAVGVANDLFLCDIDNSCQIPCGIPGTGGTNGTGGSGGMGGSTGGGGTGGLGGTTGLGGLAATGGMGGAGGSMCGSIGQGGDGGDPGPCSQCEAAGTAAETCGGTLAPCSSLQSPSTIGCIGFPNPTDKAECFTLLNCLRSPACRSAIHDASPDYNEAGTYPQPFDDPHPCLCGDIPLFTCLTMTSGWTGVCASQYEAAAAADGLTVSDAFADALSAAGVATNVSLCDIDNSCETECGTEP